ncbi:retropepsin-like aspartic protease family protein [Aureimonas jatrophae]|uniref:Aspartyl protease family protein n=1 Tax=Aureimonas jatrophae TaxID=1166073 RepID=A0A1H0GDI4_9HYPH|nr:TIGR02281 family clan AA aspartic protease [Aureimonas jatrophae]MBB3949522.1 aspartyl protease family protein [Aureimonas jatrophae]SDO04977.1 aspartyl protease family protein [Aureimonas jatrophae]
MTFGPFGILLAVLVVGGAFLVLGGAPLLGIPDGDFAGLLYGGVLAAVIGAGVLRSARGRWVSAALSAGTWLAAFAVVTALYVFGPELRFVGDRMLSALQPGRTSTTGEAGDRRISVERSGDGQFHVDASVNGVTLRFVADTGASVVALDQASAARAGIPVDTLHYGTPIRTANGVAQAAGVRIDRLSVGGIERRNVSAVIVDQDLGIGLLGLSFLDTFRSVEFRGNRLILTE